MKKYLLLLISILCFMNPYNVKASYMENHESEYIQPNKNKVTIYTTGDEYFRYSHDKDNNVLVINNNGYYVYATLKNGKVVPSSYVYDGINVPKETIKKEDIDLNINSELIHKFENNEVTYSNFSIQRSQNNGSGDDVLNFNNTIIFIRFAGESEFVNENSINSLKKTLGSSNSDYSSLKSYVNKISNGKVNLNSNLLQVKNTDYYSYQSSYKRGYLLRYSSSNTIGYKTDSEGEQRLHSILESAIKSLPQTDTKNVDANGDGYIDNIIFIVNGYSSPNWSDILWPHQWQLSKYGTPDSYSGAIPKTYNLQFAGNNSYTDKVSVFEHETMHSLGLPDLYRYYDDNDGVPVGYWDMMSNDLEGTYINSYIRYKYGLTKEEDNSWIYEPNIIKNSGEYTLDLASTNSNNTSYLIETEKYNQFIQLEYRGNNGNDIYDKNIPGKGLLISRINDSFYGNIGFENYDPEDEYYIFRPNESALYNPYGGFGNLNNAAITPCIASICNNSFGLKNPYKYLSDGAITLTDGSNTQTVIKNVRQVDSDTIRFQVFKDSDTWYLNYQTFEGVKGDIVTLEGIFLDTEYPITYRSSNENVATVDSNGLVTIKGVGTTTIIATSNGESHTLTVTGLSSYVDTIYSSLIDANSIELMYISIGDVIKYNIYRSTNKDEGYEKIGETDDIIYVDNNIEFGNTYYYKVGVVSSEGEYISKVYTEINTKDYLPKTPTNVSVVLNEVGKATITFDDIKADGFNVYESNNPIGPYVLKTKATSNTITLTDLKIGQNYYYKVGAYNVTDDLEYEGIISDYDFVNTNDYLLDPPTNIEGTVLSNTSIKLVFDEVEKATGYNVYRSTGGSYTKIGTTNTNSYIDKSVVVGKTYYYKVSAIREDIYNGYRSNSYKITLNGVSPTNFSVTSLSYNSVKISYNKMAGVSGYEIYYSTSKTGTYKKLVTTTSTSYTHKNLTYNKYYYYKVRSYKLVDGNKKYSNFTLIKSGKPLTQAPNVTISQLDNGVKLSWDKVTKANKYIVYLSTDNFETIKYTKTVTNPYYTFKNIDLGTKLYFKVVSYNGTIKGNTKVLEYTNTLSKPTINLNNNTIEISNVLNAEGYKIYKNNELIDTTTNLEYTSELINNDELNTYYVVAYKGDLESSKSNTVSNINKIKTNLININSISTSQLKIDIEGEDVNGYYLYILSNGKYKFVKSFTGTTTTYDNVSLNKTYYFKVRPYVKLDGKVVLGNYSNKITYTQTLPKINEVNLTNDSNNSIKITFDKVSGVTGYQIYYKVDGGTYKRLYTTTKNTYTHTNLEYGQTYYYKVRSYKKINGKTYYSKYSDVSSILVNAKVPSFTLTNKGINTVNVDISSKSNGLYKIYYGTDIDNLESEVLYKGSISSLDIKNLEPNKTYYFKVLELVDDEPSINSTTKQITVKPCKVTNFKASSIDSTSIKLTWTKDNVTKYELYLEDNLIYSGNDNSYIDENLKPGKEYNYSIRYYYTYNDENHYSDYVSLSTKAVPLHTSNVKITSNTSLNKLTITFDKVKNATGYRLYSSTSSNGTYKLIKTSSTNKFTDVSVTAGKTYYYKVVPYIKYNGIISYRSGATYTKIKVIPKTTSKISSSSVNHTTSKVTWNKVSGVSGYELYYSTSQKGTYTRLIRTTSNSYTHTKRTIGKTYYYKVRSYKTVNGTRVYSNFSDITSVKVIPATLSTFTVSRYNYSSTKNKISFTKVSGIDGYAVYKSTDGVNYKLLKITTKNYVIDENATGAINYYKIKMYKKVNGTIIYGNYTTAKYMKAALAPSITTLMSSKTDASTSAVVMLLNNNGSKTLTILNSGAVFMDSEYDSFNRVAKLIDTNYFDTYGKIKYVSKFSVKANSSEMISFVFDRSTWYDQYSMIGFYFLYDGVKYISVTSSRYGMTYQEV